MRGAATLKKFMTDHGIESEQFFGRTMDRRIVDLRCDLIRKLNGEGLNNGEIARVMKMDRTTVLYWLSGEFRAGKLRTGVSRRGLTKISHCWDECATALAESRA